MRRWAGRLAAVALLWGPGCARPDGGPDSVGPDSGAPDGGAPDSGAPATVALTDDALVRFRLQYQVAQAHLVTGDGGRLRWEGLSQDDHGLPVDPVADVTGLTVLQLQEPSLQASLDGMAAGTLAPDAIVLQLRCTPTQATCAMSDLVFEIGHAVDVAARFVEGSGPWLAWLSGPESGEPVALLELVPDPAGPAEATVDDQSSALSVEMDAAQPDPLPVPRDGQVWIDWSALRSSSQGAPLSPLRLDRAVLARVDATISAEDRVLRLSQSAPEAWTAEISGTQGLWLPDLSPAEGQGAPFSDLSGTGEWLLALYCTSCTTPQPAALVTLQPT